jgi:copper chaperone CopZ
MKKTYKLTDIDCANCAAKIETNINKIDGVNAATVNFFAQKLILDADDARFDEILEQVKKAVQKVERDCEVVPL